MEGAIVLWNLVGWDVGRSIRVKLLQHEGFLVASWSRLLLEKGGWPPRWARGQRIGGAGEVCDGGVFWLAVRMTLLPFAELSYELSSSGFRVP